MDAIEFHSEIASNFDASYEWDANRLERIQVWGDFLNRYAADATFAYDVGCGSGVFTCEMARRGIETVGIDGAAPMLRIAEEKVRELGLPNVSFLQDRLPIANTTGLRRAELIISSSVIEYLDSIPESLCFLRNLLKENGVVIFSIPNRDSIRQKFVRCVYRLMGRPRYLGFSRHFMTVGEIKEALSAADLTFLEYAYFGRADGFNRVLGWFLWPRFSSNMIIVVARKELHS